MKILVQYTTTFCASIALSFCVNSCAGSTDAKTTKAEGEVAIQVASNSASGTEEKEKAPIQLQFRGCKAHR